MTTDRHDPERTSGLSDEFWGEQTEWVPREPSPQRSGPQRAITRWWDALLGGGAVTTRSHGPARGSVDGEPAPRSGRSDNAARVPHEPARHIDGWADDTWKTDEAWTVEPESRRGRHPGADPLLARLGSLAVIVTLAAPVAVGFTANGSAGSADALLTTSYGAPPSLLADPTTTALQSDQRVESMPGTPATGSLWNVAGDGREAEPGVPTSQAATMPHSSAASLEAASEPATRAVTSAPPCGAEYELAAGDYWIRIADAAGVSLSELLEVNDSSVDTVLVPGRSICLPVGAATPPPPTTVAPTWAPSAPTASPAPAPAPAPSSPTTTVTPAPTTTVVTRPAAVPQSQAVAIIRDVWPGDLEERALDIAWRESNLQSNVNNYCCYGLFQIHWEAHRSWLSTLGVTSVSQLYDPVINATAAYTLYQRSGGFGPWGG
jgi:LysM repeat protein